MTNKTFLTIILTLSLCLTFGSGQAVAAFGDCISWIWGGKNESTTYSPPYTPPVASVDSANQNRGGQAASSAFLGQSTSSATPVYGASPSYAGVRADEYYPSSHSALKPIQSAQPATELRPVVKKEWTYSPVTSVAYKPVQQIDPQTGQVSTYYRAEESKTLLPWLHQKETIEYKPVLVPPKPLPAPSPQVVQANYAANLPSPSQTYIVPAYDPCNPCGHPVWQGTWQVGEPIPVQTTGDLLLNQSPNASSTVSTYVSRNTGAHNINFGVPPVRTPASAADQIPVVDHSARKPEVLPPPLISEADLQPVQSFSETVAKPEIFVKTPTLIKTPMPDLPALMPKKETSFAENQRLVPPTQVYKKYQP